MNMGDEEKDSGGVAVESLQSRATRMLAREPYHYCGDCHTHCRQTLLLAEAFKEAQRQVESLRGFAQDIMGDEIGNLDGFEVEEAALKHGLLRAEQRTEFCNDPNDENSECACAEYYLPEQTPFTCNRRTALLNGQDAGEGRGELTDSSPQSVVSTEG